MESSGDHLYKIGWMRFSSRPRRNFGVTVRARRTPPICPLEVSHHWSCQLVHCGDEGQPWLLESEDLLITVLGEMPMMTVLWKWKIQARQHLTTCWILVASVPHKMSRLQFMARFLEWQLPLWSLSGGYSRHWSEKLEALTRTYQILLKHKGCGLLKHSQHWFKIRTSAHGGSSSTCVLTLMVSGGVEDDLLKRMCHTHQSIRFCSLKITL